MKKQTLHLIRLVGVCVFGLVMLVLVSACAGVTQNTNGTITANIVGQVQSVDASKHSVTLNVNGQMITVSGLTDQQIAALQSQIGKNYSIHATQGTDGSYNINSGTDPQENDNATPGVEQTEVPGAPEAGSISFTGTVKSVSNNNIQVSMPDGKDLSMNIVNGQTDLSKFNGSLPSTNQLIKVKAVANTDGSFMAQELKPTEVGETQDQNIVDYQGVTTSAVSGGTINFKVGNNSYSYTINANTEVKDFANAQAIGANQPVKVKVQFNGSTPVVLEVQNAYD